MPPHGNFVTEPIAYRGPYEYSVPGANKDFTPQWEKGSDGVIAGVFGNEEALKKAEEEDGH